GAQARHPHARLSPGRRCGARCAHHLCGQPQMRSETGFDPALYDRFPTKGPRPEGEEEALRRIWCKPNGWEYLTVVNNNYVGIYYLGTAFLFFLLAGVLALLMRAQLAAPMLEI